MIDGLVGLDTNVIVRYLVRDDEQQFEAAAEVIESLTAERPGFVTTVTLAELYWVLRRAYRIPRSDCLTAIRRLVEIEVFEFEDGEGVVRALDLAGDGADLADALIQTTFQQFGAIEAVTFDRGAAQSMGWRLIGS
ncbi:MULTISPECIES: PIN domain-containing protein [unclassified Microbacterium]|uniref:PIN domain-containing protein n=1 Tax=unclassified Microbacterium TaxID=2609290 RepID=UPI0030105F21